MRDLKVEHPGVFTYEDDEIKHQANFPLCLIKMAWNAGCNFEDLADGFGPGQGTKGDWSGIRDSSPKAVELMLQRTLEQIKVLFKAYYNPE